MQEKKNNGHIPPNYVANGPFKFYVIKEVGGWGQKIAVFDDS